MRSKRYVIFMLVAQSHLILQPQAPIRLLCSWNSPGKNTGVDCLSLLQGIFPTQGSNLSCRQILYHLSHQGSPILYITRIQNYI